MEWKELWARREERDRRDGTRSHKRGLCGGSPASLCKECFEDEREYLLSRARKVTPQPEEDPYDFWRRAGLPFWDAWYVVAKQVMDEASQESE